MVRLKNMLQKCKRVSKSVLEIHIFFVLLLIFKGEFFGLRDTFIEENLTEILSVKL